MPVIAQIKFCDLKFSDVHSKALDVFIISTPSLILNLKKALILGRLKPGQETLVPCFGSAGSLNSAPLDGAEDPAEAAELGINTHILFSSGLLAGSRLLCPSLSRILGMS